VFLRGELGLSSSDRPRGAFLAVDPIGTGKTELVLLSARYLFGEDRVRRIDLSEFQRADAVKRLLGAGPGDSGVLGRLNHGLTPRVWLFDELEKAHPKVFDLFIQIVEPDSVTLATGEKVSFQNDYLAFTSNLGSAEAMRMARSNAASVEQAVLRRVGEALRPELIGRIPEKLVFGKLSDAVQRERKVVLAFSVRIWLPGSYPGSAPGEHPPLTPIATALPCPAAQQRNRPRQPQTPRPDSF